jgi:hypothetical protein
MAEVRRYCSNVNASVLYVIQPQVVSCQGVAKTQIGPLLELVKVGGYSSSHPREDPRSSRLPFKRPLEDTEVGMPELRLHRS